jgi:DNA (cytosine-5)-methyltransferase 1
MQEKLTVLDLFSGIGGFSLGLERAGFETIAFCEIESFCQKVLQKHWPDVPVAQDIRQLRYENGKLYDAERLIYQGRISLICGGFPCQPFSVAGRKRGTQDHRDLWPEMFRIIQQAQPDWIIGENVANFTNLAFTRTKTDLESEGYTVQPFIIPACAVGAPYRRDRVWIIAYNDRFGLEKTRSEQQTKGNERNIAVTNITGKRCNTGSDYRYERPVLHNQHRYAKEDQRSGNIGKRGTCSATTDDGRKRIQGSKSQSLCREQAFSWCKDVRRLEDYFNRPDIPEPLICRDSNGFSSRVDRLRALGNSVVPQIPEIIGQAIINSIKD